ncbi:545_t:CDS:2 [Funneliformis mosseae]|uniref:545_t:CDS:1 n=1 Tax=Funneliformis mosseae TaxID=27381 RepID=A0A9N8YZ01_FUNMO|nr:545_t:CDS:2 [Funneliformis mosseae]
MKATWITTGTCIVYKKLTNIQSIKGSILDAFIHELKIHLRFDFCDRIVRCFGISKVLEVFKKVDFGIENEDNEDSTPMGTEISINTSVEVGQTEELNRSLDTHDQCCAGTCLRCAWDNWDIMRDSLGHSVEQF